MNSQTFDVVIIGAGLSGLSTAHFIKRNLPDLHILILERSGRVGGAIRSCRTNGYLVECGPHGFLDNVEESRELLSDLNMGPETQKASLKEFIRYLCLEQKLVAIPQHPIKIVKSGILPFAKKVRVLADVWKRPSSSELTVADWVAHRFGRSILPFADAVVTGTYAGDIGRLSMDAVFPGIRRMELECGSVLRGLFRSKKKRPKKGLPSMTGFRSGMEALVRKLAEGHSLETRTKVDRICRKDSHWFVEAGQKRFRCKRLVVAADINRALELLSPLVSPPLPRVPVAHLANVAMGFRQDGAAIPHGFGFLAPQKEKRFALGALFSSRMFPNRAPDGHALIEVMVGGRHHPHRVELSDDELVAKSYEDLALLLPLKEQPTFAKVFRTESGFPQLEMGHLKMQDYKNRLERQFEGLFITGFGWMGIGMNEMVKQAKAVAVRLATGDPDLSGVVKAKGVYF